MLRSDTWEKGWVMKIKLLHKILGFIMVLFGFAGMITGLDLTGYSNLSLI